MDVAVRDAMSKIRTPSPNVATTWRPSPATVTPAYPVALSSVPIAARVVVSYTVTVDPPPARALDAAAIVPSSLRPTDRSELTMSGSVVGSGPLELRYARKAEGVRWIVDVRESPT